MIEAIHIGPEDAGELHAVESVRVLAGMGVEGDRHFQPDGAKPGQALTLVEAENVEDVGLAPGGSRRQLTTRGVRLNDLVGKHFKVGDVECYGVELCEPCEHLQSMTRPGIIKDFLHRSGINADVLTDGVIRVGDAISA